MEQQNESEVVPERTFLGVISSSDLNAKSDFSTQLLRLRLCGTIMVI